MSTEEVLFLIEQVKTKHIDRMPKGHQRHLPSDTGFCSDCKTLKPAADFNVDKKRSRGLAGICKACVRKRDQENSENKVKSNRHRNYGIDDPTYQSLKNSQGGVCAICGEAETAIHKGKSVDLAVDHDHATGEVRGLLCRRCNSGLASFRDSPSNLSNAIDYLMGMHK